MSEKITILYVDDEPINIMLFAAHFNHNFNVITAESGTIGLGILKSNKDIRAVISDMKMPEMNGIEFIRLAKNEFPHIPYFILTGYDINDEIASALNNNLIQKYFRKPFNENEIIQTLEKAIHFT